MKLLFDKAYALLETELVTTISPEVANSILNDKIKILMLKEFVALLNQQQVKYLLFKGAALSLTKYDSSWNRPRLDSDVWIAPSDKSSIENILLANGYSAIDSIQSEIVRHQKTYFKKDRLGRLHYFDIHWSPLDPIAMRNFFDFERCYYAAVPAELGDIEVKTLSDEDHFILCCCHWVAHHFFSPEEIWISDIKLLIQNKSDSWWTHTVQSIQSIGASELCVAVLRYISKSDHTLQIPKFVFFNLESTRTKKSLKYFLREDRTRLKDFLFDLNSISSIKLKFQFLIDHLFPKSFPNSNNSYASNLVRNFRRIFTGFHRLFSKTRP